MSIQKKLTEEIENEFAELGKMQVGSEEYKTAVDGLTKLVDRAIEMEKFDTEFANKIREQEIEHNIQLQQMKEEKKDRMVRNGIAVAGIAVPVGVTIWGALKSWEFEKTGTVTTSIGKMFMNGFRIK